MQPLVNVSNNGSEFRARMMRIAAGLDGNVNRSVRNFAFELITRLNVNNPIDTGQARSNWKVTINDPSDFYRPLPDYAARRGKRKPDVAAISSAFAAARATIDTWTNLHRVMYIQNNAPYIGFLNNGTDRHAATYFVETSIAESRRVLTQLRLIG
jgi:hypothetical protein